MEKKFAFLGVGNMASAIINGIREKNVCLYDKLPDKVQPFLSCGYTAASSAAEAVVYADYIVLSVKPQNIPELFAEIKDAGIDTAGKIFISIVAGLAIPTITAALGPVGVVRTMPNTPLMIGRGVTALTRNEAVPDADFESVCAMFRTVGDIIVLPEEKMNAVISTTSSAPAYVYLFIDAIRESAVRQGLDDKRMLDLICQMVIGSAEMIRQSGKTPAELIRMVTSPNGTTERAMKVFEESDLRGIVDRAMIACTKRAEELSQGQ